MFQKIYPYFIAGILLLVTSFIEAQEQAYLCGQHVVQAALPFSSERIQRMSALDQEQRQLQQILKDRPETRQVLKIPVVFHVLHNNGPENISYEQILDAMVVLNRDYRLQNQDANNVVNLFNAQNPNAVATPADIEVEFVLAQKAPDGTCFNGITRTVSHKTSSTGDGFVQLDEVINNNDIYRGIWPAKNYMNVIVVANSNNTGGYTFMPGSFNLENMYGSIWVNANYVGRFGTSAEGRSRVMTHEVGHWLNLHHVWGGNNNPGISCGDDEVIDTPETKGVTSCALSSNTCGTTANVENYMDYSYCSKMFTHGQKDRMRACLYSSERNNLWTSANQVLTGIDGTTGLCFADFYSPKNIYCIGETVSFIPMTNVPVTSWKWEVVGANPAVSTLENPQFTFSSEGIYTVKFTAYDGSSNVISEKNNYIRIVGKTDLPYFQGFENATQLSQLTDEVIFNNQVNQPTFEVNSQVGATGNHSLILNNFYFSEKFKNEYISPAIDLSSLTTTDKVTLSFKYAYRKKSSATSETLSVLISKDCGQTWQTRKTIQGSSFSNVIESDVFVPTVDDFKLEHVTSINSQYFGENFQFKFVFESNGGNNLYLDDINLYLGTPSSENVVSIDAVQDLKKIEIYPNPVSDELKIANLSEVGNVDVFIVDLNGKIVINLEASEIENYSEFRLNVSNLDSGVYFVKIGSETLKFVKK